MYTNVKAREDIGELKPEEGKDFAYGGWYQNPPGTRRSPPQRTSCEVISAACPSVNPPA